MNFKATGNRVHILHRKIREWLASILLQNGGDAYERLFRLQRLNVFWNVPAGFADIHFIELSLI